LVEKNIAKKRLNVTYIFRYETIFIKKEGNSKVMLQENLPLNVFSSMKTLQKRNKHLFSLANEERKI